MPQPRRLAPDKNKQATSACLNRRPAPCSFVISGDDALPGVPRFCDAPALPGSAYCAEHHARCAVRPDSAAGRRAIRRLKHAAGQAADPPRDLAHLASVEVAELDSGDDPAEIAACLYTVPERDAEEA
jgi:hypothetical protein